MVNSFLLWLCGLILIRGKQNMLVCSPILELHRLRSFWLPSLSNWIVNTEDINDLIIPTITMGRQQEVVVFQLWLWFHRAKLAMQGLFQILIIHCKLPKRSRILRQIIVLQAFWNGELQKYVFSQLNGTKYLCVFILTWSEAVTHLRQPGALCCPELLGFATFVM